MEWGHGKGEGVGWRGGRGASWSASAEFKLSIDKVHTGREVTARIFQSGSAWKFKDLDADSLFHAALDYPDAVKKDPVIRSVALIPYNTIQDSPSTIGIYIPLLAMNDTVNSFLEWHREYREILSDIEFVTENQVAFQNADPNELATLKGQVQAQDDALERHLVLRHKLDVASSFGSAF